MKNTIKTIILISTLLTILLVARSPILAQSTCAPTTAKADLDINNIRTTVLVGGDMWWDLTNPKYEVPVGSGLHSLYAGALWIGGVDGSGQLKVAAQTYRQTGTDFWGGPINKQTIGTTNQKCLLYDRHWKLSREEVQDFVSDPNKASNNIKSWPGNGDLSSNEDQFLAPFIDVNADGVYDYRDGDYPGYNFSGQFPNVPGTPKTECNDYLFGDQTIWWVFNDVGNVHSETSSASIGLEIRAQAFAFKTNDEINNMTFYKYQIINRSISNLNSTYIGQWVDPDLGNASDDYVGCDVNRGLGYCYNGDADDDGVGGYGTNPPAVGVDFFQGPIADLDDGIDNDRDGCVDCTYLDSSGTILVIPDEVLGEQIIMSKFVYYDNINGSPTGNPNGFTDFYQYMGGIWLDNVPMTYGGNGRDPNAPLCDFMFPGTTDPTFYPTLGEWSEVTAGNVPEDRRFLQSAGKFTLAPGAVNYVTTGVVWARSPVGGPLASVNLVQLADDKAQALFDNCFKLIDGPDAPDLAIRELNNKVILSVQNYNSDKIELYNEVDPTIIGYPDSLSRFKFEGYQIYQLKDATVTTADIGNPDKIRLLLQCDIRNGVTQLVNFEYDPSLNANIPTEKVNGADAGIKHTFVIENDLFAKGSTALVNQKTYFYTIVSYAHNEYKKYDPNDPLALDGQKKPYLAGRNNIRTYSAIPHSPDPENNGMVLGSDYGDGPQITRIEGQGNGGMVLDFLNSYESELMNSPFMISHPTYKNARGPVNIKVFDPTLVKAQNIDVRLSGVEQTDGYSMYNFNTSTLTMSERPLGIVNEQVLPEWGLTSTINTVTEAGKPGAVNNAFLESSISYSPKDNIWLSSLKDLNNLVYPYENWIESGPSSVNPGLDDEGVYEKVVDGTWGPYKLTSRNYPGPYFTSLSPGQISLSPSGNSKTAIASVDIIITPDKSKWSRACVVETGDVSANRFNVKTLPSIGKDGQTDNSINSTGMSWFPGYAVNLETGERLNIAFGENSIFTDENGNDMKWNPTGTKYYTNIDGTLEPVFGGMHYIYVFGHNADNPQQDVPLYDSCRWVREKLDNPTSTNKRLVYKDAMWVSIPILSSQFSNLSSKLPDQIPSEVKVRIRIARTYRPYASGGIRNNETLIDGMSYYVASTPVTYDGTSLNLGDSFVASASAGLNFIGIGTVTSIEPKNGFYPYYNFNTNDLDVITNDKSTAVEALNLINVVPNPYYAYSEYETSQIDNRIKITNLPPKCTISIFTMSGALVRKFNRDIGVNNTYGTVYDVTSPNTNTSLDWDLKNHKGIPVGSGMYLIHVSAPGLGEKTLKWFGMTRPLDLDTF